MNQPLEPVVRGYSNWPDHPNWANHPPKQRQLIMAGMLSCFKPGAPTPFIQQSIFQVLRLLQAVVEKHVNAYMAWLNALERLSHWVQEEIRDIDRDAGGWEDSDEIDYDIVLE